MMACKVRAAMTARTFQTLALLLATETSLWGALDEPRAAGERRIGVHKSKAGQPNPLQWHQARPNVQYP